jgi:hypothetical protein
VKLDIGDAAEQPVDDRLELPEIHAQLAEHGHVRLLTTPPA